jgi:hypothetical protein
MTPRQLLLAQAQLAGHQPEPYRVFPDGDAVWVYMMTYGKGRLCLGHKDNLIGYDRGYCYESLDGAFAAADQLESGDAEPQGWMRNLQTGRYRLNGDPAQEYGPDDRVENGRIIYAKDSLTA